MKKTTRTIVLASLLTLAIIGSAFAAANSDYTWDVTPSAKALAVARAVTYDQSYLDAVNSGAGADIIPSAKALTAAKHYKYDKSKIALVDDDAAGSYYFASEHQSAEVNALVNKAAEDSLICTSC